MVRVKSRNDSTSLILCAGRVQRVSGLHKQLLPVSQNELFVQRIVRQARQRCSVPIVITGTSDIEQAAGAQSYDTGFTKHIVETLGATCHLWGDRTNILLGDVCYSADLMNGIMTPESTFEVFAKRCDILALSFDSVHFNTVLGSIAAVLFPEQEKSALSIKRDNPIFGTLRHFVRVMLSEIECEDGFFDVYDYSRDVDNLNDYRQFFANVVFRGLLDDE